MNKRRNNRFQKFSGVYKCRICGKMTRETGQSESGAELCAYCFEQSGWNNSIVDESISEEEYQKIRTEIDNRYKRTDYVRWESIT